MLSPINQSTAEEIASFLITHNVHLSALEFYQDMLERDIYLSNLKDYIEEETQLDVPTVRAEDDVDKIKYELQSLKLENENLKKQIKMESSPKKEIEKELLTLSDQLRVQQHNTESLLQVLAERLPTVLTSVRSSRKDSLIDILVTVIHHHPIHQVRSSLIFHFITLFKRPDSEQRTLMLEGISTLVEKIKNDPSRIEKELLSTIKSLLEYRYPEQRVLAVQMLALLYDHLLVNVQQDIVAILGSMVQHDTSSVVREASVVSLASCLLKKNQHSEKTVKFANTIFIKSLTDSNQKVQKASVQELLPILVKLSVSDELIHSLILQIIATIPEPDGVFVLKLSALQKCLSSLRDILISTVPSSIGKYPEESLSSLLLKAIKRQTKGVWTSAEQLFDTTVHRILKNITQTRDSQQKSAVDILIACCHTTDQPVLDEAVTPLFLEIILRGYQALGSPETDTKPRWCLIPSYMRYSAGVHNDNQKKCSEQLSSLLSDAMLHYCEDLENVSDLTQVLCGAAEEYPVIQDILLSLVWDCMSPTCDDAIRVAAAQVFQIALSSQVLPPKIVLKKALPPALTLLTDPSKEVRVLAGSCAAFITSQVQSEDALSRIGNTLVQRNATSFGGDVSSYRNWLKAVLPAVTKNQKLQSTAATLIRDAIDYISEALQKGEASEDDSHLSSTITVLCDFSKGLLIPAPPLLSSFRTLQKCIPDNSPLCNLLISIVKDREAIDEGSAPKRAFLAKFRELLPNTDEKDKRDISPKADSVEGGAGSGGKHSLLSKMQQKFFGSNSEGQREGNPSAHSSERK